MHDLLYMVAVAGLGLSGVASAVRLIEWLVRTDPRIVAQTGRWAALGLAILSAPLLLALLINEKWTAAMAVAAIMLFAFAWYGPRLLQRMLRYRAALDVSSPPAGNLTPAFDESIEDTALVRRSIAVLEEYLRRSAGSSQYPIHPRAIGVQHSREAGSLPQNGSAEDRSQSPNSRAEALDILGLPANASERDIREAHQRLWEMLRPEHGGSPYLTAKIDQARSLLLGQPDECSNPLACAQSWPGHTVSHCVSDPNDARRPKSSAIPN